MSLRESLSAGIDGLIIAATSERAGQAFEAAGYALDVALTYEVDDNHQDHNRSHFQPRFDLTLFEDTTFGQAADLDIFNKRPSKDPNYLISPNEPDPNSNLTFPVAQDPQPTNANDSLTIDPSEQEAASTNESLTVEPSRQEAFSNKAREAALSSSEVRVGEMGIHFGESTPSNADAQNATGDQITIDPSGNFKDLELV